jgi:hypothetical protein
MYTNFSHVGTSPGIFTADPFVLNGNGGDNRINGEIWPFPPRARILVCKAQGTDGGDVEGCGWSGYDVLLRR